MDNKICFQYWHTFLAHTYDSSFSFFKIWTYLYTLKLHYIRIRIIIVNDSGTTILSSSGINASASKTLVSPFGNDNGAFPGFKKTRDVEPMKYAIHPINKAKNVDATIPILTDRLSLIA